MTVWTDLFPEQALLSREFFRGPATGVIRLAPAKAAIVRVSANGAGGWTTSAANQGAGGGGAFARYQGSCTPAESFTLQVGDIAHTGNSAGAGDALGDSIIMRTSGSVVICKAARGKMVGGTVAGSVGDTKRAGLDPANSTTGGASAGDDVDDFPLGFGGRGVQAWANGAQPGGGGFYQTALPAGYSPPAWTMPPGSGLICLEFYNQDPGYGS